MNIGILQQECPLIADYTGTDVPVTIAFDEENSIITPGPGELQRFCYIVTQVEEPIALSHWVLGICPDITEEDLGEVTVTINGEAQEVIIGENVEIFNPPDTDPTTGCSGIKFDFALEEQGDVMTVCFELLQTYQVGSVEVCIKGGGPEIPPGTGEFVCGPVCGIIETCETTVFQNIDVCVPITITPDTIVGPIDVRCCGPAIVSTEPCPMTGPTSCVFYVRQSLCAEVPIRFSAMGDDGDPIVSCGDPNQEGCVDCPENGNGL